MKKRIYFLNIFAMLLYSGICTSQQVISAAGGNGTGTNVQLSWTVGEPVIETFTGSSAILTQGFHQSKLLVTALDPLVYPGLTLTVFPNPVSSELQLEIKGDGLSGLSFRLFDINGKMVQQRTLETFPGLINMENYASGTYLLKVFKGEEEPLKTFKIIKN